MIVLAQSAFLGALGWALLHSLWQMGLIWLLYVVVTANGQRFSARQRYNLALGGTVVGSLLFVFTLLDQLYAGTEPGVFSFFEPSSPITFSGIAIAELFKPALPYLSGIYLLIVVYLFLRFLRQYYYTAQLINSGLKRVAPELRLFLQESSVQLGIRKKIRLGFSDLITSPLTVGFWKPVILLPVAIASHLSLEQTEAVILHELNHIRKNDYLVNLLIATFDIVLFFNPFSRLLSATLVKERENSCDDLVLQFKYRPAEYAKALLLLEQNRMGTVPALAVSATGHTRKLLLNRVQRILHGRAPGSLPGVRLMAFLLFAFLLGIAGFFNTHSISEALTIFKPAAQDIQSSEITPVFTTATPGDNDLVRTNSNQARKITAQPKKVSSVQPEDESAPSIAIVEEKEYQPLYATDVANVYATGTGVSGSFTAVTVPDREYSIDVSSPAAIEVTGVQQSASVPYIPSSSFSYVYQINNDTAFPSRYYVSESELNARRELENAIATLENLDMTKLEKGIGASAIQLKRLELQLKKTLQSAEWQKMSKDLQANYKAVQNQLRLKQAYLAQAGNYVTAQGNYKQLQQTDKQQKIVLDRIMENQQLQKCVEDKQKTELKKAKVKKIVVI